MEIIDCNQTSNVLYQVKQGDSLGTIANNFDVKVNNIVRNNYNIELYDGEIVKIMRNTNIIHIVKPMETLYSIAVKYKTNVDDLIKINGLTSKRLFIGQQLTIIAN